MSSAIAKPVMNRLCVSPVCSAAAAPNKAFCFRCLKARGRVGHVLHSRSVKLYAIEGAGLVKIGVTAGRVKTRLSNLQCGSPVALCLLGSVQCDPRTEGRIHMLLFQYRSHGEWFRREGEATTVISLITAGDQSQFDEWLDARLALKLVS